MKIKDLIEELKKFDEDLFVEVETNFDTFEIRTVKRIGSSYVSIIAEDIT